ncbi:MAG: HIT family protein [Vulcanimicrobiota bacterium]
MSCPFCHPNPWEVFYEGTLVLGLWNGYPVTPGHALLVTRRHVPDWFAASPQEVAELSQAVAMAREVVEAKFQPDGFNIGTNIGEAAGQTVFHLHLHVLPRYFGQLPEAGRETDQLVPGPYHLRLKKGGFLAQLAEQLEQAQAFDMLTRLGPAELEPIQAAMRALVGRGGQLRSRVGEVPCEYFRVRYLDGRESVWLGGPDWHYSLLPGLDRDGQRELRRAFEQLWAESV